MSTDEIRFIRQIKEIIKHYVSNKYSLCDLFDVNNYAWPMKYVHSGVSST